MKQELSKIDFRNTALQENKLFFTFEEYKHYSVIPKRKYRKSYKDNLMKIPFVVWLTYKRAKRNFFTAFHQDNFLIPYQKHFLDNTALYENLRSELADEKSKEVLDDLIAARFSGDFRPASSSSDQYFESELVNFKDNEVFVDCGAWVGDSTDTFLIHNEGKNARCYIIEPDIYNMQKAQALLKDKNNATFYFVQKGVSDKKESIAFKMTSDSGSSFQNTQSGCEVLLDTIDEIVQEPATFIKMDLEGFEEKALLGAKNQIAKYHPTLAISIYHKPDDFIKLWNLIKSFDPENKYKYFIRHYCSMFNETILYAIGR